MDRNQCVGFRNMAGDDGKHHADSEMYYDKTDGATNLLGQKYEYGLCTLSYLRLLKRGKPFLLGCNMASLEKFDDIFIRDSNMNVYATQLKHKEKSSEEKFNFGAFYDSYCEIKEKLRQEDCEGNLQLIKDIPSDKFYFVFYCNYPVRCEKKNLNVPQEIKDLLSTGKNKDCIFTFSLEDNDVKTFLEDKEGKDQCREFLSHLLIFSAQSGAEDVLVTVKETVAQCMQLSLDDAEPYSSKLLTSMESWWGQRVRDSFLCNSPPKWFGDINIRPTKELCLESTIEFQGCEIPLSVLGDYEELCNILTYKMLLDVRNGLPIRFGRLPKNTNKIYIRRTLEHETILNKTILMQELHHDLLAVSNCPRIQNLPSSTIVISAAGPQDSEEDRKRFRDLCARNREIIHWVSFSRDLLVWKESAGPDGNVKQYAVGLCENCSLSAGICSHDDDLSGSWKEAVKLVTGHPGMGKTTLLQYLAADRKKQFPESWVILVPLADSFNYLAEISQERITFDIVLNFLHQACSDPLSTCTVMEKNLLSLSLKSTGNVYVLLDAVDEVAPQYQSTMVEIVRVLKKETKIRELIISSRTVLESYLQEYLPSVPLVLKPFSEEQQLQYLEEYLKMIGEKGDVNKKVEQAWKQVNSPGQPHICDVPLNARILADIIYSAKSITEFPQVNLPKLYETFFALKHDIYYYEKKQSDRSNVAVQEDKDGELENFIEIHEKFALVAILDNEQRDILAIDEIRDNDIRDIDGIIKQRLGIIVSGSYDRVKFVHISFAEFLVAGWLKKKIQREIKRKRRPSSNQNQRTSYWWLLEWHLENVRRFFDQMIVEECDLHRAILYGDMETVQTCLGKSMEINKLDLGGRSPLHLAILYPGTDLIEMLLEVGCSTNEVDLVMQWEPIFYADYLKYWRGVIMLLKYFNGDVNQLQKLKEHVPDEFIRESIISAGKSGNKNTKRLFTDLGFNLPDLSIDDALHLSIAAGDIDVLEKLLQLEDSNDALQRTHWVGPRSYTLLHEAANCGNTEAIHYLLGKGANISSHDRVERTPLHYAACAGQKDAVVLLVENGADPKASNMYGETVIDDAAEGGHLEIIKYLVENGANVQGGGQLDRGVLYVAAEAGYLDVAQYLIEQGASQWAKGTDGRTALYGAAKFGRLSVVEFFIENGADVEAVTAYGVSSLYIASLGGHESVVKYLLDHGANIHATTQNGRTALHAAAGAGHLNVVQRLVERGADIHAVHNDGWTPLRWAAIGKHFEVVSYLLQNGANANEIYAKWLTD